MCGISGIFHFDNQRPIDKAVIKKMTDSIAYRGPDGEGYFLHKNIALGHRRLSIIDISTGGQPMYNDDKSIVLVFNGEIYNYIELRKELKSIGYRFKTDSDTEVIINAYLQWGTDCQNKFNGMWAFALWDGNKKQLFISRDRIGEKPLFYATFNGTIIFGSEIKALVAYGMPKVPNLELLELYLFLSYIPAPFTFFKDIHKLKAGYFLIVNESGVKELKYWDLPDFDENQMITDPKEVYKNFQDLLTDSVKIRMRSDVPYGAFLSGGLDSSSIVALMAEISSFPVETFTIGFTQKSYDERHLANLVAGKFNTRHHEHLVKPESFDEILEKICHQCDEPFGDSSAIPTGHVSKFAAKTVKMVLTGDGGDEALSGYTSYQHEKFATYYQRMPDRFKINFPRFLNYVARPVTGDIKYKLNRAQIVSYSSNLNFQQRFLYKTPNVPLSTIKQMMKNEKVYPIEEYLATFMKKCTYQDPFYQLMYLNYKLSLPDDMLVKVDRMSMANSLETRSPFLDVRLIEYMVKVHKNVKMKRFQRKTVLRNTIGQRLPNQLLIAPKKGFSVPLLDWFKSDTFYSRLDELEKNIPFLEKNTLKEVYKVNPKEDKQLGNFIWMLFVLSKTLK